MRRATCPTSWRRSSTSPARPTRREFEGRRIEPLEGQTLLPVFAQDGIERKPMFWEHEGNAAVRIGRWKLVKRYPRAWELYDIDADRTELHDLAAQQPERVADMARAVRRLGGALRRDSAREDRRPDEQPGGDAGVLGEGRIATNAAGADVVIWQWAEDPRQAGAAGHASLIVGG